MRFASEASVHKITPCFSEQQREAIWRKDSEPQVFSLLYLWLLLANPQPTARWGHIRNPSELRSAGVLQARERTVTIPAVRHDTPVLGSSKLLFEVTNGSLQRSNQLCGFYSCPRQLPNCVNGYFGENKERLTQKIQKGKFHCTLIFPFWKRQGSYLSPGGVALGKSDFIPYNNPLY